MKPRTPFSPFVLIPILLALLAAGTAWAQDNSRARIVRLSFVAGDVTVQRPDVQTWAEAPANTPLQEGFHLSTAANSFAEIQFENGGTIRLGETSLLDLTQLERTADGGTINHVDLRQGYATFHPLPSALGEPLQVGTAYGTVTAQGGTLFRVDLQPGAQRVEVFEGVVDVQSNIGDYSLDQDSVLILQPGTDQPAVVTHGITRDDWDNWVDDRESQSQAPPNAPSPGTYTGQAAGSAYGWNDLLQYGTWSNVPGIGYGWSPNLVASGWAPYSTGQWCWYPGWGYTWIGAEPWGWLPYHYGGWNFVPGKGWVWFPVSLRDWSPGQVTWFHGPDWVGWTPRHIKDDAPCARDCGGGAVTISAFRSGGRLTASLMLGVNPASGQRVQAPDVLPTPAAKLTGPAVSFRGAPLSGSTIVYDPQQHRYVNSDRVAMPMPTASAPTQATTGSAHAEHPGRVDPVPVGEGQTSENQGIGHPMPAGGGQPMGRSAGNPGYTPPVPVEGREQFGRAAGSQGYGQPGSGDGFNTPRMAPFTPRGQPSNYASPRAHGNTANPPRSAPSANPSFGRTGGGEAGGGHFGGGQAAGGGGHAAGSGGGHR